MTLQAPVQCVDDVNGIPRGVIVFDDKTFTIPFSQVYIIHSVLSAQIPPIKYIKHFYIVCIMCFFCCCCFCQNAASGNGQRPWRLDPTHLCIVHF